VYCNTILDLTSGASVLRLRGNAWDQIPPLVASVPAGCVGSTVVLLAADPLADIRNTRRITAVVLDGRWLAAEQLAALVSPLHHAN
jgi:hypothetical protein